MRVVPVSRSPDPQMRFRDRPVTQSPGPRPSRMPLGARACGLGRRFMLGHPSHHKTAVRPSPPASVGLVLRSCGPPVKLLPRTAIHTSRRSAQTPPAATPIFAMGMYRSSGPPHYLADACVPPVRRRQAERIASASPVPPWPSRQRMPELEQELICQHRWPIWPIQKNGA
jgi:hypothetical protein